MITPNKYRRGSSETRLVDPSIPKLHLKYNPFPDSPSVSVTNEDKRLNGGLFNPRVRSTTVKEFQEKFIDIDFNYSQHLHLGFLWSVTAGESKGFGKTALLAYYLRQINKNYGADLLSKQKVAAVYTKPTTETNTFKKLAALICDSLLQQDPNTQATVLTDAIRTIRFTIIDEGNIPTTLFPITLPNFDKEEDFELLTNPNWVEHEWRLARLDKKMYDYLIGYGLREDIAEALSVYNEKDRFKISDLMAKRPSEFLFNDAVSFLRAAGFNGLYIFIDDLAQSINAMSEKSRDAFANDVRHWFIDGPDSKAARERFFTSVMIFHPDLDRSLAGSWRRARLHQIASFNIDLSPGNNVILNSLDKENTIELLKAYTQPAIDNDLLRQENPLHPLNEKIAEILMGGRPINPGALLKKAYELIEQAKRDDLAGTLSEDYVRSFVNNRSKPEIPDDDSESYIDIEFG